MIEEAVFARQNYRKNRHQIAATERFTVHELKNALDLSRQKSSRELIDEEIRRLISSDLHDRVYVFRKFATETLSPHRLYDHSISLREEFAPSFGPLYELSRQKLETL